MARSRIFLDMDGVLADFDKQATKVLGCSPASYEAAHGSAAFWDCLYDSKDFFYRMSPVPDAHELVMAVRHLNPTILTGKPRDRPGRWDATSQKRAWRDFHFPDLSLIACPAREKCLHMEPGDIIIDDRLQHSHLWLERGGVWIHHESAEKSIHILQRLGVI